MSIKKVDKDKEAYNIDLWIKEVQKRRKFGISKKIFFAFSFTRVYYCSIKYFRDFDNLYTLYSNFKNIRFKNRDYNYDAEKRNLLIDSVNKYKRYTFEQVREAGGALKLSSTCQFVHIIDRNELTYRGTKLKIYHRIKDAIHSTEYPDKVLEIFKNDKKCKAVAFLYKEPITRQIMVEKFKIYELMDL